MKIWVDIDNAPHVLVLDPLIRYWSASGHTVRITARENGQTLPLLRLHQMPYQEFGRHAGRRKWRKAMELLTRSASLARYAGDEAFDLAVCHGARGVILPSRLRRIPLVLLADYEHAFLAPFRLAARRTLVPDVIPDDVLRSRGFDLKRVAKYPGLKEEFYIYDFEPDAGVLDTLGLDPDRVVAVVRPPATTAHYHVPETDVLFRKALDHLLRHEDVQIVLLPRDQAQREELERQIPAGAAIFPDGPLHGPNLLWHADVVLGAGGTMNREAACLGVPVHSLFRGTIGAVDRHLADQGRLRLLTHSGEIDEIVLEKRERPDLAADRRRSRELVGFVADRVLEVA